MKLHERINYLLLGTLWALSIVLVLDFWLNTAYNFNMFSNAHWQYVANLQASNKPIATGFYTAITLAIIAMISGMYILFRPKFRKILLSPQQQSSVETPTEKTDSPAQQKPSGADIPQTPVATSQTNTTIMQRPPRLHVQSSRISPLRPVTAQPTQPEQKKSPTPQQPMYTHEIREIFEKNNYVVLNPRPISQTPISLIALGANESLWVGACEISHEKMADIVLAFKGIFQETLDSIEININAFIINPTDTNPSEAIADFNSLSELSDAIARVPNDTATKDDSDIENMDAFKGYIETVLTYLGNK